MFIPHIGQPQPAPPTIRTQAARLRAILPWGLTVFLFAFACNETERTPDGEEKLETPTPADVADEPANYLGKRLTLIGNVEEISEPRAFQLRGNTELLGDDLLVVAKSPVRFGNQPLAKGDDVVVVGRVSQLQVMEIERELEWDLSTELEVEWQDKAVLIAESVSKVGRYARWSETKDDDGVWLGLTSIFVAPDPESFVGDRIELDAAPIQEVVGDGVWLGHSNTSRVLVIPGQGTSAAGLRQGKLVDVEGTLRQMPEVDTVIAKLRLTGEQAEEVKQRLEGEYLYIEASAISIDHDAEQAAADADPNSDELNFESFRDAPSDHLGRAVQGEAEVSSVVSDRAFWLESEDGKHVLGVVEGNAKRAPLTTGQRVRFKATAKAPKQTQLASFKLPPAERTRMESEAVVLAMEPEDVEVVGQGPAGPTTAPTTPEASPGTDQKPAPADGVIRLPATADPPPKAPNPPTRPETIPPKEDPAIDGTAPQATSKARAQRTPTPNPQTGAPNDVKPVK